MLLDLSADQLGSIVAFCDFIDACELALTCTAARAAFVALRDAAELAQWPELVKRRRKALHDAQAALNRWREAETWKKRLRLMAAVELQRRLRSRYGPAEGADTPQRQFMDTSNLATVAASVPFEEYDGEGDRPDYAGSATLFLGVRLGYDELRNLLYAGRRWYGDSDEPIGSQALHEPPHSERGYHDFKNVDAVNDTQALLRKPDGYEGPEWLRHDTGLNDLLKRLGMHSVQSCHVHERTLRSQALDASRAAVPSHNEYGRRWKACFDAHAAYMENLRAHGENLRSLVNMGYTGWGDAPGDEVVLGIQLGPRQDMACFNLEPQFGVEFCEESCPGYSIEQVSADFVADLLRCRPGSLNARSVELAMRGQMTEVVKALEVGSGVKIQAPLAFHVVFSEE